MGDKKSTQEVLEPKFDTLKLRKPKTLTISQSAWDRPGVRVAALSRISWKTKGARMAIILLNMMIAVMEGCHYIVIDGGLVDKAYIQKRIKQERAKLSPAQARIYGHMAVDRVIEEVASQLYAILPKIKPPFPAKNEGAEFIRYYITTSPILDGPYGERIAQRLMEMRAIESESDIRVYKPGEDYTRIKGVGQTAEEKKHGQKIGWLSPRKHRLPGQYASTAPEKEIREAESTSWESTDLWVVGGLGASVSKPGGGERKRPFISLPASHIPMANIPGEPSVTLNQIGMRVIEVHPNGDKIIRTWNLRDLAKQERSFVTGAKAGSTTIHRKIIDAIKTDRHGLHIGEIAEFIGETRSVVESAIEFLVEPRALKRVTWPGLYRDEESHRYNFHQDWLQESLRYPWDYDKDYKELRRLLFGCMHAGYTTTDYEYIRHKFPEHIERLNIGVLELIGDITAGLKHNLIHRGQIISGLNYTEQEILAAELLGTVIHDVFISRFNKKLSTIEHPQVVQSDLDEMIASSLLLFLYIVGNHEGWQKDDGHTPGVVFKEAIISLLNAYIGKFLEEQGLFTWNLDSIIRSKVVELPEERAVYEFEDGISCQLFHPSMSRTMTSSIRLESALNFSECRIVDIANFHTAVNIQKWDPDARDNKMGQREGNQVGAMCPWTDFENGKLKTIDFGPGYSAVRYKDGRIFMSEHQFFSTPIIKEPIDKNTDVNTLKDKLKLLRSPIGSRA